ncbi:hypothetical protein L7F22_067414 [Adiantum nelumboides]|nr:hypothetical protein [Adiantum nelumboides]
MITNKDGVKNQVLITSDLINEALHLLPGTYDLIAKTKSIDNEKAFLKSKGSKFKYLDMIYSELELPLWLISQDFKVQKPPRYTEPLLHMAVVMALCVAEKRHIRCDYVKFILESLIEANLKNSSKNKLYMSVGPMLTRIAYQALGMIDDLPAVGSQASLIQLAQFVPKAIKTTTTTSSSRSKGSSKKDSSDDERTDTDKKIPPSSQRQDKQEDQPKDKADQEMKKADTAKPRTAEVELQVPLMQFEEPTKEEAYEESQMTRKEAQNHELIKNEKKLNYEDARFQKINASYNTISQAETHLHIQLPPMTEMPDLPSTKEEQQVPTLGALDVRGELEQEIEDMPEGPAKEYLLYEKKKMESAALAFLQPEEQVKDLGHDFLPLPLMHHEAILWKEKMRPTVPRNKDGGYEGIPLTPEQAQTLIEDLPRWRRKWLNDRPNDLTHFHNTPQALQTDPTYCPVPQRRS